MTIETEQKQLSLTRQTAFLVIGRTYASLCFFLTYVFLSHMMSTSDYGLYRQVWLVYNTLAPVFLFGIPATVAYFVPLLSGQKKRRFIGQTGILLAMQGLCLSLLLFFAAPAIAVLFSNPHLLFAIRAFAFFPVAFFPLSMIDSLLVCAGEANRSAAFAIAIATVQTLAVVLSIFFRAGIERTFFVLVLSVGTAALGTYLYLKRRFHIDSIRIDQKLLKEQVGYGASIGLGASIGILGSTVDKWIIAAFFTADQFAVYSNGAFQLPFLGIITGSVMTVLTPAMVLAHARGDSGQVKNMWHLSAYRVALLMLPIFCFMFAYAKDLLILFFGQAYSASTDIFRINLLTLPLRIVVYSTLFRAIAQTRYIFFGALQTFLLSTALSFILVYTVGFTGPAIASVISAVYLMVYYNVKICGLMKWKLRELFPWKSLSKAMACGCLAGLVSRLITSVEPISGLGGVGVVSIGVGLFIAVYAITLPAVDPSVVQHVRAIARL